MILLSLSPLFLFLPHVVLGVGWVYASEAFCQLVSSSIVRQPRVPAYPMVLKPSTAVMMTPVVMTTTIMSPMVTSIVASVMTSVMMT